MRAVVTRSTHRICGLALVWEVPRDLGAYFASNIRGQSGIAQWMLYFPGPPGAGLGVTQGPWGFLEGLPGTGQGLSQGPWLFPKVRHELC